MALISTLVDNFNDNSIDTGKWFAYTSGSAGSVAETNNQIEITTSTSSGETDLISQNNYDFTGSQATIKIVDTGNQSLASYGFFPLYWQIDSTHYLVFVINGGIIYADYRNGGAVQHLANASYNATTHRYVKIREASGTIYWDYSADGTSWSNLASVANPFAVTALQGGIVTQYGAEASTTTAKVDDFNILPSEFLTGVRFIS